MVGDLSQQTPGSGVDWAAVEQRVQQGGTRHKTSGSIDSVLYHAATTAALMATTAATLLATLVHANQAWIVAVVSGTATVLIGLERTMRFGPRWRDHQTLRAGYDDLLDKVTVYRAQSHWSQGVQEQRLTELMEDLRRLRRQEGLAPKAEAATAPESPEHPRLA